MLANVVAATPLRPRAFVQQKLPRRTREDSLAEHLVPCAMRAFEAKEHLFREGDRATHVYRVEVGLVCVYRMLPDGRRQIMDFAFPGDFVGLGALQEHVASAQASARTSVRCFPLASLREIVRHDAEIGMQLYEAVSHELLAAREILFTVSQRTATERLAGFLLSLSRRRARRGENSGEIVLPMTRADIADFLGLTIETVSRTFTKFRNESLIDLEQCILVTITDAAGLARAAGEGSGERMHA